MIISRDQITEGNINKNDNSYVELKSVPYTTGVTKNNNRLNNALMANIKDSKTLNDSRQKNSQLSKVELKSTK